MDYVDVAGLRIGFRRRGAGTPLVLLHGAVCDSRVWRVELESFADALTVVAWDAPGCGGSADPPPDFRLGEFADALAGLLGALDFGPAHVLAPAALGAPAAGPGRTTPALPPVPPTASRVGPAPSLLLARCGR
jgi:pimeloyl-ACP methyl ester carboxylesterase